MSMLTAASVFRRAIVALALPALGSVALGAPRAPVVEESASERRAVRGVPVEEASLAESPELREVRRFEEGAFPRDGQPPARLDPSSDVVPPPLPAGLEGRWSGSGDIPPELRSPATRAEARPAPAPDSEWLRALVPPELPVRWEPQVVRFLEFFKNDTRGRAIMTSWVRKLGRYRALVERTLERHGLPKDLVFLAMIESGFEPGAVSRVGAGGVWQFMPGVGRAYGLEVSHWVDARRDPERAAEAAARYLKDLHVRFGSWYLAFAAYHAGYGGVLRSIQRFNTNDYWELCRHEAGLPWETTLYVPKILAAAIIGHNLAAFGFGDVAPDPPFAYDKLEVSAGTTLATVARAAGARQDAVEALNPELVRGRTPPDRGATAVRLPVGTGATCAQALEGTRTSADRVETVVLRFGESLEDVARARGLSVRELKKLNGARDAGDLRAGAAVVVPVRSAAVTPPKLADSDADDEVLVGVPERNFSYEGRERVFYRAREGDALEEIAGVFGVSTDELVEWNNLDPDAKLHPKLVLQIFVRKDFDRAGVALLDPGKVRAVTLGSEEFLALEAARRGKTRLQYTARPGDTLAKIARRYGLQPGDLARINRLSYSSELASGQKIYVYSPTPELPREVSVGRTVPHRRPTGPTTGEKPVHPAGPKAVASAGKAPVGKSVPIIKPAGTVAKSAAKKPETKASTPPARTTKTVVPARRTPAR
jgi:membrane-bound lytic murein transglycosylase D